MKPKYALLFLLAATFLGSAKAQENPLQISVSSIRTDLKQPAIKLGLKYIESLDNLWGRDNLRAWDRSLLTFTPEFNMETGNNDAFSSVAGKLTGFLMCFKTTEVAGVRTPRTDRMFHVIPFSAGFETSNAFQKINGIIEVGYLPWYQIPTSRTSRFLQHTKVALFLQGGYKFEVDTALQSTLVGGRMDESKEPANDAVLRLKGHAGMDTKQLWVNRRTSTGLALIGTVDGWYDLLHSEVYYRIEAKARVFLSRGYFFDLVYEKGSGAPNFNQGEQFGAGLTVTF